MRAREYPELGERLYRSRVSNGLLFLAAPKPGYIRRRFPATSVWYAHFAAFYASDQRERFLVNARQRGL